MELFLKRNGAQEGPFTSDQLEALLREGRVSRTDLAFHEGLSNWMPLAAVLAPRTKPPPFQVTPRTDASPSPTNAPEVKPPQDAAHEPVSVASLWSWVLADRPWNLRWSRWLIAFAILPALAVGFCGAWDGTPPRAVAFLAFYFVLVAALGLRALVKPAVSHAQSLMAFVPVPAVVLTALLLLGLRFDWTKGVISATADGSPLGKALALFCIWLLGQTALVGVIYWARTKAPTAPRLLYLGALAGMLLAATPGVAQYLETEWLDGYRGPALGAFRSPSVPNLLASMATGLCVGGMLATVLTHWLRRATDRRVVIGGTIVSGAVWMTFHSLALTTSLHAVIAGVAAFGLVACIRMLEPSNRRLDPLTLP